MCLLPCSVCASPCEAVLTGLPQSIPSHSTERVQETQKEWKTKRNGVEANEWWKDFMPPPQPYLFSCLLCLAWRKVVCCANELLTHNMLSRSCRRNPSWLDASASSSLLARHHWHSQSKLRSPNTSKSASHEIRELQMGHVQKGFSIWSVAAWCLHASDNQTQQSLLSLRWDPSIWPSTICYSQINTSINCSCLFVEVFPFKCFFFSVVWQLDVCSSSMSTYQEER